MWQDICLPTVLSQAHAVPHWREAVHVHMEGLWKSLQGVVNSAESRANPQRGETVCLRDLQQELSTEGFISCPQKASSRNHSELYDNFYLDAFYLKFAAGSTLGCFLTRVLHVERNSDTRSKTTIFWITCIVAKYCMWTGDPEDPPMSRIWVGWAGWPWKPGGREDWPAKARFSHD